MVDIQSILEKRITSGILFYVGARTNKYLTDKFVRKHLKEHSELAVGLGLPVALDMTGISKTSGGMGEMGTYVDAFNDAVGDYGFFKELEYLVDKEPLAYATDANTIETKNFNDLTNAKVYLDGTLLTSGTDYTISNNTISLANAMASGEHDLVIVDGDGKHSFSGKIYV